MADGARYSRALILGASVISFAAMTTESGLAQTAEPQAERASTERPKQAKRKPAKPLVAQQAAPEVLNARAQAGGTAPVQTLDTITVAATKTKERAIDALAPVSSISLDQIQGIQPNRLSGIFYAVPGVSFQERGDDPATVINIRGLQEFAARCGGRRWCAAELPAHRS
ncbi:outer membrane receptor protein involved in Fe transport [Bradyrhizobium ottawaense]